MLWWWTCPRTKESLGSNLLGFKSGLWLPLSCQIRWGTWPSLFSVVPQPREYLDAFILIASHSHFVLGYCNCVFPSVECRIEFLASTYHPHLQPGSSAMPSRQLFSWPGHCWSQVLHQGWAILGTTVSRYFLLNSRNQDQVVNFCYTETRNISYAQCFLSQFDLRNARFQSSKTRRGVTSGLTRRRFAHDKLTFFVASWS